MPKARNLGLALALVSFTGACSPTTIPADMQSKLQSLLQMELTTLKTPGMAMAVQVGDGEPWVGAAGVESEWSTAPVTPQSQFRLGSITKNFLGTVILEMVDEGTISLDDTLEKWLPGAITGIDGTQIKIRNLLQHTSGIESYTNPDRWIVTVYTDPQYLWNAPGDLLALAAEAHQDAVANNATVPVGTFEYSNTNFILLGMIAAKAAGLPEISYDAVLRDRIFERLNLPNTAIPYPADASLDGSTNHGHVDWPNFIGDLGTCQAVNPTCADVDTDFTTQEMSNAWSAGSIRSNVLDVLKFTNQELRGNLIKPETQALRESFIDPGRSDGLTVGLALFRQPKYGIIGHRGEIFGFNATLQYFPDRDTTIVVLANRTALDGNHVGPVPEDVIALMYPDIPVKWTAALSTSQPAAQPRHKRSGAMSEY